MTEVIIHDIAGNYEEIRQAEIDRLKAGVTMSAVTRTVVDVDPVPGIICDGQQDDYAPGAESFNIISGAYI